MIPWFFGLSNNSTVIIVQDHRINNLSMTPNSIRNFLSNTVSLTAFDATTYLASIVESIIHDCLILLKLTVSPPNVKTYPEVDFLNPHLIESQISISYRSQLIAMIN